MNARMIEAAIQRAERAYTFEEMQRAAAELRAALNAEEDEPSRDGHDADELLSLND